MSGPKSNSYTIDYELLEEARRALRAQADKQRKEQLEREMQERKRRQEQAKEAARKRALAREREEERLALLADARSQRREVLAENGLLASRLAHSLESNSAPGAPAIPDILQDSTESLREFLHELSVIRGRQAEIRRLVGRSEVLSNLGFSPKAPVRTAGEMLSSWRTMLEYRGDANESRETARRTTAMERVLGSLMQTEVDALPLSLEQLLGRAINAEGSAAFDLQMLEISIQVQQHNNAIRAKLMGRAQAEKRLALLESLDAMTYDPDVMTEVSEVTQGFREWSNELEVRSSAAIAEMQAAVRREHDEAASHILAKALGDLGYQVEGVSNTLFAEGGELYFQADDWGDRYMRMKVIPDREIVHYNLVRSSEGGPDADLDREIETRWCDDHAVLIEKLRNNGILSKPLRALAVGAYPAEPVEAIETRLQYRKKNKSRPANKNAAEPDS